LGRATVEHDREERRKIIRGQVLREKSKTMNGRKK
jgi:hypothetical protein